MNPGLKVLAAIGVLSLTIAGETVASDPEADFINDFFNQDRLADGLDTATFVGGFRLASGLRGASNGTSYIFSTDPEFMEITNFFNRPAFRGDNLESVLPGPSADFAARITQSLLKSDQTDPLDVLELRRLYE